MVVIFRTRNVSQARADVTKCNRITVMRYKIIKCRYDKNRNRYFQLYVTRTFSLSTQLCGCVG